MAADAVPPQDRSQGVPGHLPEAPSAGAHLAALVQQQFRGAAPPTLRVVGAIYVILSGSIFLQTGQSPTVAGSLWAITAGLGVLTFAAGTWLRNRQIRFAGLEAIVVALAIVHLAHACLFAWITAEAEQAPFLLTLLAGGGFFFLRTRALVVFEAAGVVGWGLTAWTLGLGWTDSSMAFVLIGVLAGVLAHVARRRHLLHLARGHVVMQGTLLASEERFRALAETAKDAIMLVDEGGRLTYLNPAGMALFALRPHEVPGRFLTQVVANGGGGTEVEQFVGTGEVTGQRRDGATFPAELSLARSQRGGATVYTGILRDITERKRAAAETRAAATREAEVGQLRQMNEFKTRFLNMAAHELNTPLTPLRLQMHLLKAGQMGELNERQRKAVALLDRNVTRLSGLVGEILEVARLQSGRIKLSVVPVGVDEVVDEVVESFSETARRVGVEVTFAGQQNLTVLADRNRVTQVLFNLVSNALKFTPAGGRVTVEATPRPGVIEVAVHDTGIGLTHEQMDRLFQPFIQVHDPMAVTAAGTGLGLYISKGLVEAQGGTISCSSGGPGLGSTFRFTLPVAAAGATPDRPAAPLGQSLEDPMVRRLRELI